MAHSTEHLDFASGHDLAVVKLILPLGSTLRELTAWDSPPSPSVLPRSLVHIRALSLLKNKTKQKEQGGGIRGDKGESYTFQ